MLFENARQSCSSPVDLAITARLCLSSLISYFVWLTYEHDETHICRNILHCNSSPLTQQTASMFALDCFIPKKRAKVFESSLCTPPMQKHTLFTFFLLIFTRAKTSGRLGFEWADTWQQAAIRHSALFCQYVRWGAANSDNNATRIKPLNCFARFLGVWCDYRRKHCT